MTAKFCYCDRSDHRGCFDTKCECHKPLKLVREITTFEIPHDEYNYGRIKRIVIDLDMAAISDYVLANPSGGSQEWTYIVASEILGALHNFANKNNLMAEIARMDWNR